MRIIVFAGKKEQDIEYMKQYINVNDYIIACDGGLETIDKLEISPNVLIGDFDSTDNKILERYNNVDKIEFPAEKDFSDFEAVLFYCEKLDFDEIFVFGVIGGRLDHTLSNVHLLNKNKHFNLKYIDKDNEIFVANESIVIKKSKDYLSFISSSKKCVISIQGVKYELFEHDISDSSTFTISNEIVDDNAILTIHEGSVMVILSNDI